MRNQTRKRPQKTPAGKIRRWGRYLELIGEAGTIVMSLRDKPRTLDWLALAVRSAGLVSKIHRCHRELVAGNPWKYFDDEGFDARWVEVPDEFRRLVVTYTSDVEILASHWDGNADSVRVLLGQVGTETVGWLANEGDEIVDGPYVLRGREEATYAAIGQRLWARHGTRSLAFSERGLRADERHPRCDTVSEAIRQLHERLAKFSERGISRSVLLVGPPGTGKSTAIRHVVGQMDATSLRVELDAFFRSRWAEASDAAVGLETLVKILQPEVLIVDDIDRLGDEPRLLSFLEDVGRRCRFVLASANCQDRMLGAALRPGRFDEVVRVDRLDQRVLREMLAPDDGLADRMASWPVAYVAEFVKRRDVLGPDHARAELAELEARIRKVEALEGPDDAAAE